MRGFNKGNADNDKVSNAVPPVPECCTRTDCESRYQIKEDNFTSEENRKAMSDKTTFAMMKVAKGNKIQMRIASEVSTTEKIKGNSITTMKDGYRFVAWFTRCALCFSEGVRKRKVEKRAQGEHHYYC